MWQSLSCFQKDVALTTSRDDASDYEPEGMRTAREYIRAHPGPRINPIPEDDWVNKMMAG